MYGYGYRYNSGLVIGAGGGAPFANTYSLSLDGVDDYLDVGDSDDFSFGNGTTDSPFSVSTWINLNSSVANSIIFSKDYASPNREYAIGFFNSSSNIRFFIKSQGGNNQQSIDSTTSLSLNTWYNVICTYDGSGGNNAADGMNIYINGVLETPTNIVKQSYIAMSNTTALVNIGRYGAAASQFLGNIDEPSIFNRAVTPAEIVTLSTAPTVSLSSLNPLAWYRNGDGDTYPTITDNGSGGNDGTMTNMDAGDIVSDVPL